MANAVKLDALVERHCIWKEGSAGQGLESGDNINYLYLKY